MAAIQLVSYCTDGSYSVKTSLKGFVAQYKMYVHAVVTR